MIDQNLIKRARSALVTMESNGPGAVVLRELVEAVEAAHPPDAVGITLGSASLPALAYLSGEYTAVLTSPQLDLRAGPGPTRVQLRIMAALIEHAREVVDAALEASNP